MIFINCFIAIFIFNLPALFAVHVSPTLGRVTKPDSLQYNILELPTPNENENYIKEMMCSNTISCMIYILATVGRDGAKELASINYINSDKIQLTQRERRHFYSAITQIRFSSNKKQTVSELLPKIATVLFNDSKFEPEVDVVYNGTHFIFSSIYPKFSSEFEEETSTYDLKLHICFPMIHNNIQSRCSLSDNWHFIIHYHGFFMEIDQKQLRKTNNSTHWWIVSSRQMLPENTIVFINPSPIQITQHQADNYFAFMLISNWFIFIRGKNIELKYYSGRANVTVDDSMPLTLSVSQVNASERVVIKNLTSNQEYSIIGTINSYNIIILETPKEKYNLVERIIDSLSTNAEALDTLWNQVKYFFESPKKIIMCIVAAVLLFAGIWFLRVLRPYITCLTCCCKK